tara:strand:+ start:289 stop:717 length:429 start_codon:yes stop_codon:yes gene_type:complete
MISQRDKIKLSAITAFIDIVLITVLFSYPLQLFDKIFVFFILCSHLAFYICLYFYYKKLIDILHCLIFVSLALSVGLENIYLLIICLALTLLIQILWVVEKRCILFEKDESFGIGDQLEIFMILLTFILSYKIGAKRNASNE